MHGVSNAMRTTSGFSGTSNVTRILEDKVDTSIKSKRKICLNRRQEMRKTIQKLVIEERRKNVLAIVECSQLNEGATQNG